MNAVSPSCLAKGHQLIALANCPHAQVVENAYFSISSSENPSDEAISSAIAAAFSATPAEEQPAVRADAERAVLAFSAATAATIAIGEGEGEGPVEGTTGEGEGEGEGPVEGTTGEGEGEGPVEDGTGEGEGPVAGESEYSYALDDELDMLEADFAAADAFAPAADDDAFGYAF
eukprot:tig00000430_g594.t1